MLHSLVASRLQQKNDELTGFFSLMILRYQLRVVFTNMVIRNSVDTEKTEVNDKNMTRL